MAFEDFVVYEADKTISLGGFNKTLNKPNPTKIEGFYLGVQTGIKNKFNPEKPNCLHLFMTKEGITGVWGKTKLNKVMKEHAERDGLGFLVRAIQEGTRPTGMGNDQLLYQLKVDKSQRIKVEGAPKNGDTDDQSSVTVANLDSTTGNTQSYETLGYDDDGVEDSSFDEEEVVQEVPPARAVAPRKPLSSPDAARQAKVQALLSGRK